MDKIKEILDEGFGLFLNNGDRGYWAKLEKPTPKGVETYATPELVDFNQVIDLAYQEVKAWYTYERNNS